MSIDVNGIVVDTPGIGGVGPFKSYSDYRQLFEAAAVVVVVTSLNRPVSDGEREAVKLAFDYKCNLVSVITHCDNVEDPEDLVRVAAFHRDVFSRLGFPNTPVFSFPEAPTALRSICDSFESRSLLKPMTREAGARAAKAATDLAAMRDALAREKSVKQSELSRIEGSLASSEDDQVTLKFMVEEAYTDAAAAVSSRIKNLSTKIRNATPMFSCENYRNAGSISLAKTRVKEHLENIINQELAYIKRDARETLAFKSAALTDEAARRSLEVTIPTLFSWSDEAPYHGLYQKIKDMRESPGFLWSDHPKDFEVWFRKRIKEIQHEEAGPVAFESIFKQTVAQYITKGIDKCKAETAPIQLELKKQLAAVKHDISAIEDRITKAEQECMGRLASLREFHRVQLLASEAAWYARVGRLRAALWRCNVLEREAGTKCKLRPLVSSLRTLVYLPRNWAKWLVRGSEDELGRSLSSLLERKLSDAP
jgi:hypothetical protein